MKLSSLTSPTFLWTLHSGGWRPKRPTIRRITLITWHFSSTQTCLESSMIGFIRPFRETKRTALARLASLKDFRGSTWQVLKRRWNWPSKCKSNSFWCFHDSQVQLQQRRIRDQGGYPHHAQLRPLPCQWRWRRTKQRFWNQIVRLSPQQRLWRPVQLKSLNILKTAGRSGGNQLVPGADFPIERED